MNNYCAKIGCFFLLYFFSASFSPAYAMGFFGYSPQAKKFIALCKGQVPQNDDSKKIIAAMRTMAGPGSCEQNWEQIKKINAFDFHGLHVRDISALSVIKRTKKIDLHDNLITDLSPLNDIAELSELNLADNCLMSMQSLRPNAHISTIAIYGNMLSQQKLLQFTRTFHHLIPLQNWSQQREKQRCLPPGISLADIQFPGGQQQLPLAAHHHPVTQQPAPQQRAVPPRVAPVPPLPSARGPSTQVRQNHVFYPRESLVTTDHPHHAENRWRSRHQVPEVRVPAVQAPRQVTVVTNPAPATTVVARTQLPIPPRPAPLPPQALNLEVVAAEHLAAIKQRGLSFSSVIMMEEISSFATLKEALGELGLTNVEDDDIMRYLYQTKALFEEINPRYEPLQNPSARAQAAARVNNEWITQMVRGRSYTERLNELINSNHFRDSFYLKFYTQLISDYSLFSRARYPGGETGTDSQKSSDIILLLTGIKQENTGSAQQRCLAPDICSHHGETFNSGGQQAEWYVELRYKLYKLYRVYSHLEDDKKLDLLSYLLHGGSHCNDAKWHAINDAFVRFCPEDAAAIENEYSGSHSGISLEGMLTKNITKLKISELTSYINKFVDRQNRNAEYCSTFSATWDALAPRLGLHEMGHRYQMENSNALHGFDGFMREKFTAVSLTRALQDDIKSFLKKYYLGPLAQLTPEMDKVVNKILRFYGVIY
jgi:hypothetical protein